MTLMEWFAAGHLAVGAGQLAIGAIGVLLVWRGLQQMRRAGDQREVRETARHTEAMTALRSVVQGMERQGVALERQGRALEQQGVALEQHGRVLEALLTETRGRPWPGQAPGETNP